ncbi:MAG TPA: hypothetical protein VES68_01915, partial [Candidatus Sulfotelmatobacter sp.]|nr:hypothetical protein [Candidatus Sulfotelmatobacter sp.]
MLTERERRVKGISGLVATAFLAAACSVNTAGGQEGQNTPYQPVETTPATIVNPTPEPVQTPEEKTNDEKAKEAMLSAWVNNSLNSGIQKTKEQFIQGTSYVTAEVLKVEATNLNDWQNQEALIASGAQSSQVLQVSWAGGSYKHDQSSSTGTASKYFGQIEINDVQMTEDGSFPISNA